MACQACHASKTRCSKRGGTGNSGNAGSSGEDNSFSAAPCKRCARLQIECVPHISRQGQGKKTRSFTKRKSPCNPEGETCNDDGLARSVDGHLLKQIVTKFSKTKHHPCHYGLRFLIHSWAGIAFTRRSFSLLSRASKLAYALNVPMDDVFPNMHYVRDIVCRPRDEQPSRPPGRKALTWKDIPTKLLLETNCYEGDDQAAPMDTTTKATTTRRDDRWIWIRQFYDGQSRYLVSEAFGRDVAPQELLQRTWDANEKDVAQLFLKEIHPHSKAVCRNILQYDTERRGPTFCRLKGVKLITHPGTAATAASAAAASKKQQQKRATKTTNTSEGGTLNTGESCVVGTVDQLSWQYIESFDRAYSFVEYIPDIAVGGVVSGGTGEAGASSSVAVEKGGGYESKKVVDANDHLTTTTTMDCSSSPPAAATSPSATTATAATTTPTGVLDSSFMQDLDLDLGGELKDDEFLLSLLTDCDLFEL